MAEVYGDNQHQNLRDQNVDLSVHFILVISWQDFDGYSLSRQKYLSCMLRMVGIRGPAIKVCYTVFQQKPETENCICLQATRLASET